MMHDIVQVDHEMKRFWHYHNAVFTNQDLHTSYIYTVIYWLFFQDSLFTWAPER